MIKDMREKNPHAVALGSLGGKARAKRLSKTERAAIAGKAGKARLTALSKAKRSEVARLAAKARWGKKTTSDIK